MKTAELTGTAIDWAVATCECVDTASFLNMYMCGHFAFSTDWSEGGPIIEREKIGMWPSDSVSGMWAARPDFKANSKRETPSYGLTPLITAMRCYVASKLGDEVEVPKELK